MGRRARALGQSGVSIMKIEDHLRLLRSKAIVCSPQYETKGGRKQPMSDKEWNRIKSVFKREFKFFKSGVQDINRNLKTIVTADTILYDRVEKATQLFRDILAKEIQLESQVKTGAQITEQINSLVGHTEEIIRDLESSKKAINAEMWYPSFIQDLNSLEKSLKHLQNLIGSELEGEHKIIIDDDTIQKIVRRVHSQL